MPPSPTVMTLRGWKEKQTMSPTGLPIFCQTPSTRISEPIAQAASSITGRPWARATAIRPARSQGMPDLVDA